jgi:isopentenyl-diphosphate Delta-isomerase
MSQDELVDIVDENGNFLKVVSKKEAHEKGLLHKVVITEVINSKGYWIMTKQAKGKQDVGYVSPIGGHVTSGETEIEALKRESEEEFGLRNFKYEFVGRAIFNRFVIGRQENHFFIVYKIYSDEKPIINDEIESYKYFSEEEIKKELQENPKNFGDAFHFVAKTFFPNLLTP